MTTEGNTSTSAVHKLLRSVKDWAAKAFVLFGCVLLVVSAGILIWDVAYEAFEATRHDSSFRWERLAVILIIPAFISFLIATIIHALKVRKPDNWRFVGYQIMTFLILALSLRAFGLHHAVENIFGEGQVQSTMVSQQSAQPSDNDHPADAPPAATSQPSKKDDAEDAARSIAEMAAIMILFVLAELAAFVAHDVSEAKTMLEKLGGSANKAADRTEDAAGEIGSNLKSLAETTNRIKQLRLLGTIAALHPDVMEETVELVSAWGRRVPSPETKDVATTPTNGDEPEADVNKAPRVSELCWRILLREYLKEELLDIAPKKLSTNMTDEGIPASVTPVSGTDRKDVSFIATNIGFYAKFLSSLVEDLSKHKGEGQRLCMAIVTNMLPAHCWNWPMPDGAWRSYKPIDDYRQSMLDAVDGEAQIDRVLLVYDDSSDQNQNEDDPKFFAAHQGIFWRHQLLTKMWGEWQILLFEKDENETVDSTPDFATDRGKLGEEALPLFPYPIQCAATKEVGSIYPVVKSKGTAADFGDKVKKLWKGKKLSEAYSSLHGEHGKCWALPINDKSFDLFGGRHDIMFIGLGMGSDDEAGLWADDTDCDWGVCLMSSMNVTTETMFLTIISGEGVRLHYDWCKERLDHNLIWTEHRLRKDAEAPAIT